MTAAKKTTPAADATPRRRPGRPRKVAPAADLRPPTSLVPEELRFSSKPADVELEPFFSIDDTVYYVPKEINVARPLKILNDLRHGVPEEVAVADLFVSVIGEEGFTALTECEGLTKENLKALMLAIRDKTMAQLDEIKGE